MIKRKILLIHCLLLFSTVLFAQGTQKPAFSFDDLVIEYLPWLLLSVIAFLVIVILTLLNWISEMLDYIPKEGFEKKIVKDKKGEQTPDLLTKIFKQAEAALTNAVPVEREKEIEFAHEYDGIRELDNSLPPWWKYLFYLSILFACVYLYRYHISGSAPLSIAEYKEEMAEAEIQKAAYLEKAANMVNETSVVPLTESFELSGGKKIYTTYCVPCHGGLGEGGVGPNLADEYWLHGGGIKNIFKTIKYGVPAKGMISWQTQLRPKEIQEVASYILTFSGTNPPNGKEPQGEKYVQEIDPISELNN